MAPRPANRNRMPWNLKKNLVLGRLSWVLGIGLLVILLWKLG